MSDRSELDEELLRYQSRSLNLHVACTCVCVCVCVCVFVPPFAYTYSFGSPSIAALRAFISPLSQKVSLFAEFSAGALLSELEALHWHYSLQPIVLERRESLGGGAFEYALSGVAVALMSQSSLTLSGPESASVRAGDAVYAQLANSSLLPVGPPLNATVVEGSAALPRLGPRLGPSVNVRSALDLVLAMRSEWVQVIELEADVVLASALLPLPQVTGERKLSVVGRCVER